MRVLLPALTLTLACTPASDDSPTTPTATDSATTDEPGVGTAAADESCEGSVGSEVGDCLPDLVLTTASGATWSLADHTDGVISLDFSAMWCTTCKGVADDGQALHETYGADGVEVVTVLWQDARFDTMEASDADDWIDAYSLTHPVLLADSAIRDAFGGRERPLILVAEPGGKVVYRDTANPSAHEAAVEAALP